MSIEEENLIQIRLLVPQRYDRWRLDHFIQARIPRLSRNRIQQMIRAQKELGGESLRPSMRVSGGQELVLLRPAPDEPETPRYFDIVYEDEHILAIDKPAGLPVHASARFHRNTLTAVLRERFKNGRVPTLAHRIDRETSGLMILSYTDEAEVILKQAFEKRLVHKRYLAIVHGFPGANGIIDSPIGSDLDSEIRIKMAVVPDGQPALTEFTCIEKRGDFSLVEVFPKTGRQHQIRVHLASIGTPVVGDKLYGADPTCLLEYLETGWTPSLKEKLLHRRHALHASDAYFSHPYDGRQMHMNCPLPKDLKEFWDGTGALL